MTFQCLFLSVFFSCSSSLHYIYPSFLFCRSSSSWNPPQALFTRWQRARRRGTSKKLEGKNCLNEGCCGRRTREREQWKMSSAGVHSGHFLGAGGVREGSTVDLWTAAAATSREQLQVEVAILVLNSHKFRRPPPLSNTHVRRLCVCVWRTECARSLTTSSFKGDEPAS